MARAPRWTWPLPGHPLRIACEDVAVPRRAGHPHAPRAIPGDERWRRVLRKAASRG